MRKFAATIRTTDANTLSILCESNSKPCVFSGNSLKDISIPFHILSIKGMKIMEITGIDVYKFDWYSIHDLETVEFEQAPTPPSKFFTTPA